MGLVPWALGLGTHVVSSFAFEYRNRQQLPRPQAPGTRHLFTHLHTHSHFSFGQGASSPESLLKAAATRGFSALACTDTNGVYGAVEFQRAAEELGIRPILGAHLVHGGEECVALAEDEKGWAKLCRVISGIHWQRGKTPLPRQGEGLGEGA